jgi:hypothetical protein
VSAETIAAFVALIATAIFGFVGLNRPYRDPDTGKVTGWGKVSVAGIGVFLGIGICTNVIKEQRQVAQDKREKELRAALEKLGDNSQASANVAATNFAGGKLEIQLLLRCDDPQFRPLCGVSRDTPAFAAAVRRVFRSRRAYWSMVIDKTLAAPGSGADLFTHDFTDPATWEYSSGSGTLTNGRQVAFVKAWVRVNPLVINISKMPASLAGLAGKTLSLMVQQDAFAQPNEKVGNNLSGQIGGFRLTTRDGQFVSVDSKHFTSRQSGDNFVGYAFAAGADPLEVKDIIY